MRSPNDIKEIKGFSEKRPIRERSDDKSFKSPYDKGYEKADKHRNSLDQWKKKKAKKSADKDSYRKTGIRSGLFPKEKPRVNPKPPPNVEPNPPMLEELGLVKTREDQEVRQMFLDQLAVVKCFWILLLISLIACCSESDCNCAG